MKFKAKYADGSHTIVSARDKEGAIAAVMDSGDGILTGVEVVTNPYKSTTHKEKFIHFTNMVTARFRAVTVFGRQEADGLWYYTVAMCVNEDMFCRETGRKQARRKYFTQPQKRFSWKSKIAKDDYGRISFYVGEKTTGMHDCR